MAATAHASNSTEAAKVQDDRPPSEDSGLASPGKENKRNGLLTGSHRTARDFGSSMMQRPSPLA